MPISLPPHTEHSGPYLWGIGGHEIIYVKAAAGGWNTFERVSILDRRTVEILTRAQAPPLRPSDFKVMSKGGKKIIIVRRYLLTEVTPADARADGTSVSALSSKWANSVKTAYRDIAPRGDHSASSHSTLLRDNSPIVDLPDPSAGQYCFVTPELRLL